MESTDCAPKVPQETIEVTSADKKAQTNKAETKQAEDEYEPEKSAMKANNDKKGRRCQTKGHQVAGDNQAVEQTVADENAATQAAAPNTPTKR